MGMADEARWGSDDAINRLANHLVDADEKRLNRVINNIRNSDLTLGTKNEIIDVILDRRLERKGNARTNRQA